MRVKANGSPRAEFPINPLQFSSPPNYKLAIPALRRAPQKNRML